MAMLSVRINIFEKKAGRKMKFNNKDAARFDKKKVKCYKCSELGHFARECTGKQLDSKVKYSAFKLKELDKSKEPKALLSVDSMLNWTDHEGEDEEKGTAQVYGMIAGDDDELLLVMLLVMFLMLLLNLLLWVYLLMYILALLVVNINMQNIKRILII
ncbi:ribonuclease H-like domain-containing protein [Tanacetum coccineum]